MERDSDPLWYVALSLKMRFLLLNCRDDFQCMRGNKFIEFKLQ